MIRIFGTAGKQRNFVLINTSKIVNNDLCLTRVVVVVMVVVVVVVVVVVGGGVNETIDYLTCQTYPSTPHPHPHPGIDAYVHFPSSLRLYFFYSLFFRSAQPPSPPRWLCHCLKPRGLLDFDLGGCLAQSAELWV